MTASPSSSVPRPSAIGARWQNFAQGVATASLVIVFCLFIYGIGMRYVFDHPISWVDEAVTIITIWGVLWTSAFVLPWSEHISFDIVFAIVSPKHKRWMLVAVLLLFIALMAAAMPAMISYTAFLWRERTDMLLMRLDYVYSVMPAFFAVVLLRQIWCLKELLSSRWPQEVARWSPHATEEEAT